MRRQGLVEHLHRLGPAPLGYFLREVENGASIPDHLERYSRIDPAFVRALDGDRFPAPLHVVRRGPPIMTAFALVSGSLFRAPEQRTSKTGKPFVTATIRAKDGKASQWWRVTAFSETAQAELMRLGDGDAVSVQGPLKVETYEKDGATKLSLSVVADRVLALRQPPKERRPRESKPTDPRPRQERLAGSWAPGGGPNDSIPFGAPSA